MRQERCSPAECSALCFGVSRHNTAAQRSTCCDAISLCEGSRPAPVSGATACGGGAAWHHALPAGCARARARLQVVPQAKPEVLAPAGGWPQLRAAVENGADAVYFGLDSFNARARCGTLPVRRQRARAPARAKGLHSRWLGEAQACSLLPMLGAWRLSLFHPKGHEGSPPPPALPLPRTCDAPSRTARCTARCCRAGRLQGLQLWAGRAARSDVVPARKRRQGACPACLPAGCPVLMCASAVVEVGEGGRNGRQKPGCRPGCSCLSCA